MSISNKTCIERYFSCLFLTPTSKFWFKFAPQSIIASGKEPESTSIMFYHLFIISLLTYNVLSIIYKFSIIIFDLLRNGLCNRVCICYACKKAKVADFYSDEK